MQRAPGWTRLAGIALELSVLAFLACVVMERDDDRATPARPAEPAASAPPRPAPAEPDAQAPAAPARPMEFITESAGADARYYRAVCEQGELLAGFYSDGRLRLADAQNRRFAGLLQNNHADLLELGENRWSEVFLRVTPSGSMQLEVRGGPYDARVLNCEPL